MTVLVQRVNYPGAMELFTNQALIVGGDSRSSMQLERVACQKRTWASG